MKSANVLLTECPRDAMQGWPHAIDTQSKIEYLNQLLQVGFDVLDCGSFVSPKAIPQMADTKEVLANLDMANTSTELLCIVANERGAKEAMAFPQITYLGYPFSISETFQQLNTNASIAESVERVRVINELCTENNKHLVVYISMGFGNPYGDEYSPQIVKHWIGELAAMGIKYFSWADTVGVANPENIEYLFSTIIPAFPNLKIGAHFHTTADTWLEKVEAAYLNGCRQFDGAINGIGGCPMAQDELVGNMNMLHLLQYFKNKVNIEPEALNKSIMMANSLFV